MRSLCVPGGVFLVVVVLPILAHATNPTTRPAVDRQNYIIGTQHFRSPYQFTPKNYLIEGADEILEMGSNILKFELSPRYAKSKALLEDPTIRSLTQLAKAEPYRTVFDKPFAYYFMWTYAFGSDKELLPWKGHMAPAVLEREYREIYELARHFLTTYDGTGKTFMIGNWEGDWHLLEGTPQTDRRWENDPLPEAHLGMIDWLQTRQKAIDDARRDTPHRDVEVYLYVECNLVHKSIANGQTTVASHVLEPVNPDYVSYSSYDSTNPDKDVEALLPRALDYMQSKLKPKPHVSGKRVFVGEYTAVSSIYQGDQQDARMRRIIAAGVKWGTPFMLYWQLYNNEADDAGTPQGCWLINHRGERQPVYYTNQRFYADARAYVQKVRNEAGRPPDADEFAKFTYEWFTSPATATPAASRTTLAR